MLDVGFLPPHLPLLIPPHRQVLPKLFQAQAIRLIAAQDRLDDIRREALIAASAMYGCSRCNPPR